MTKVLIIGANGRMGQLAVSALSVDRRFTVCGTVQRGDNLAKKIAECKPAIALDLAGAETVFERTTIIIDAGVHPVIGSTGLLPEQIAVLQVKAKKNKLGGIIAPNFSLGMVLLQRFAVMAAPYFPHAEIIELHHDKKQEAPSGTAVKTAAMLAAAVDNQRATCKEILLGARGATLENIPIHSVRLPGLSAHQEVLFGGEGELLTIRHDAFNHTAYAQGILLACEKVLSLDTLIYGLENIFAPTHPSTFATPQ